MSLFGPSLIHRANSASRALIALDSATPVNRRSNMGRKTAPQLTRRRAIQGTMYCRVNQEVNTKNQTFSRIASANVLTLISPLSKVLTLRSADPSLPIELM